jgi:RNA polymerase sigma factor (sigma-70 family)
MQQAAPSRSQTAPKSKRKRHRLLEDLVVAYQSLPSRGVLEMIMEHCAPMVNFHASRAFKKARNWILDKEDLVSAGYIGLTQAAKSYNRKLGGFIPFAFVLIRRAILNEIRSGWSISNYKYEHGVKQESFHEESHLSFDKTDTGFFDIIESCRDRLTSQEFTVVVYHYSEGLSLGNVAKVLGFSSRRVSRFHQSALTKISAHINEMN